MLCRPGDGGVAGAWWRGRGGRGRTAAWREVLLVGLSSGQGWSEGRFVGDLGREDGGGICSK